MARRPELTPQERENMSALRAVNIQNVARLAFNAMSPEMRKQKGVKKVLIVGPGLTELVGVRVGVGKVDIWALEIDEERLENVEYFTKLIQEAQSPRSRLRRIPLTPIHGDVTSLEDMAKIPNDFDMAIALDIFPKIPEKGGLKNMADTLRPGGRLLVTQRKPHPISEKELEDAVKELEQLGTMERVFLEVPPLIRPSEIDVTIQYVWEKRGK